MSDLVDYASPEMIEMRALVKRPAGYLLAGPERDGVAVGASYVPVVGPTLFVGVSEGDGVRLVAAMPLSLAREFAEEMNAVVARMERGDFDRAEVRQ